MRPFLLHALGLLIIVVIAVAITVIVSNTKDSYGFQLPLWYSESAAFLRVIVTTPVTHLRTSPNCRSRRRLGSHLNYSILLNYATLFLAIQWGFHAPSCPSSTSLLPCFFFRQHLFRNHCQRERSHTSVWISQQLRSQ